MQTLRNYCTLFNKNIISLTFVCVKIYKSEFMPSSLAGWTFATVCSLVFLKRPLISCDSFRKLHVELITRPRRAEHITCLNVYTGFQLVTFVNEPCMREPSCYLHCACMVIRSQQAGCYVIKSCVSSSLHEWASIL